MEVNLRQIKRVLIRLMLAGVLSATQAYAQNLEGWTPQTFAVAASRLQVLPPEEKALRLTELVTQYSLDQAWALSHGHNNGASKPKVRVRDSGLPVFVEAGTLSVPLQFYPQMTTMALLLGHDAAMSSGEYISVAAPLLYRPLGDGYLLAIVPDAGGIFEPDRFLAIYSIAVATACGPQAPACQRAQGAAMLCASLFVIAHEVTHVREAHNARSGGLYPLEDELRADAGGMQVLKRYARNLHSTGDLSSDSERIACLGAPAAYFELNRRRAPGEDAQKIYEQRKDAMLAEADSVKDEVQSLLEPEAKRGGLGNVQVSWSVTPSLVILNGVEVDPGELSRLALPVGRHRLLAIGPSGIGSVEFRVSHKQVARVGLELKPFNSLQASEVSTLLARKQWLEVLQATSNSALRPKSPSLANAHWSALRNIRLGGWIDARDLVDIDAKDARNAKSWRSSGLPLLRWDREIHSAVD